MKNIKVYIIIASVMLSASCEKMTLDRVSESNLSDISFWTSEKNFKEACNRLYTFLNAETIRFDDNRSDYSYGTGANAVSDGSRLVPATSNDWNIPYQIIFTANKIIEKAEGKEITSINRWIAEAKFWRSWAYFDLVSKYGDVPLVLKVLDIKSPELSEGRIPRETIIQQIYDDLDFAATNLPSFMEMGEADYGRASKSAALAFKARVALYEGSRQKFHNYGDYAAHLSKAIAASELVMAEGHLLYSPKPYYYLFQNDGEGFNNKENILELIYGEGINNNIKAHNIGRQLENGAANVSRTMVENYLCTDGLPFNQSPLAEYPETGPMSVFVNKDQRMSASLFKTGDPYGNPSTYPMTSSSYIYTYFAGRKYSIIEDWAASQSFVNYKLIRYAEVLLIYAEAKFELENTISDADLDKSINLLRERVLMPKLTNAFVISNGLDMREEIRRERNVELAQEGFRYNDIVRWKIAEDVLPKSIYGATYFPDVYQSAVREADGFILVQAASTRTFDPERDYLYPIPVREISLSGGSINQNPKW